MISRYKSILRQAVKKSVNVLGYEIYKSKSIEREFSELSFFEGVLEAFYLAYPKIHILQVGANDGITDDPIYRFVTTRPGLGSVVLVEPQKELIKKLRANYIGRDNVRVMNCAIDGERDERALYRIKPEYWAAYKGITGSGVSSFRKDYLLRKAKLLPRHIYSEAEEAIESIQVPCCKVDDLLSHLDDRGEMVLQVDTEGHDDKVIYTLDLGKRCPVAINYEYDHLSSARLAHLRKHLASHGYKIVRWSDSDELAILAGQHELFGK